MPDSRLVTALITIVFLVVGAVVGAYTSGSAWATPGSPERAHEQCVRYCAGAGGELAEMEVSLSPGGSSISCVCLFGFVDVE